jgi:hypothetical protein
MHVRGDLYLHDGAAYASGGHLANSKVAGGLYAGGQQQYLIRNVELAGGASGGAWSMVYSGCTGKVPRESAGDASTPSVTVSQPRIRVEKPFVALKEDGLQYELRVPLPHYAETIGPHLDGSDERVVDFSSVKVARPTESPLLIQDALDEGKDILLSPGIYFLDKPLNLKYPDQVLFGLGLATLVAPVEGPCLRVSARVPGVRVAGIMLQASETRSPCLLEWGEADADDPGEKANPGGLFDVFVRVGGPLAENRETVSVDTMVVIHSGHVYGDNLWLWRADHAKLHQGETANYPHISSLYRQSETNEFRVNTGIKVFGNDVSIGGLAVEHANGHQVIWRGNRGEVHFFQCELPYCSGYEFSESGFRGYLVADSVTDHACYAPGVYSNFRNADVHVATAVEHPQLDTVQVINPFTVKLDNQGGIRSVVNGQGSSTVDQGRPVRL